MSETRRTFFKALAGGVALPTLIPDGIEPRLPDQGEPIKGVGVLRYPSTHSAEELKVIQQHARDVASNVRIGSVICLPGQRDDQGEFKWDFRIEGGDPGQVQITRNPPDTEE